MKDELTNAEGLSDTFRIVLASWPFIMAVFLMFSLFFMYRFIVFSYHYIKSLKK